MTRPAETSGVAAALALLVAYLAGIDDAGIIVAIGVVIGFVPAAVTFVVELVRRHNGGGTSTGGP